MADDALVADLRRGERGGVDDGAVLDRRAGADHDAAGVAAEHGARPDRRLRADRDLADDDGVRVDVGGRVDRRLDGSPRA